VRDHNRLNEISSRTYNGNDRKPAYDVCGNTVELPVDNPDSETRFKVSYDAWNRVVRVEEKNSNTLVAQYRYDGLGRVIYRKLRKEGGNYDERHIYYGVGWQALTEADGATPSANILSEYFWGAVYVDEIIGWRKKEGGESFYYIVQDGNWNVASLLLKVGPAAAVVERCRYHPYGRPIFLKDDGTPKSGAPLNDRYLFQGRRWIVW